MTFADFIAQYEVAIRLGCFFGVLAAMALWEILIANAQRSDMDTLGRATLADDKVSVY